MPHTALSRRSILAAIAVGAFALSACGDSRVAEPRFILPGGSPRLAKTAPTLAVTSAQPAFGDQGVTVDVHVFGSGFAAGAEASWLLHGVADAHVHTNKTTVISSTELVANITIASDAPLDFWDVQVAMAGGKNGVGSEMFEVTAAQILGTGTPGGDVNMHTANELGQAVGHSSGTTHFAFLYDPSLGIVNLGDGQAWGIDPNGTMALGRDGNSYATAWVRQPDNSWKGEALPRLPNSAESNATSAARAADGSLIVGGWDGAAAKKNQTTNRPVVWRRVAGIWSVPEVRAIPATSTAAAIYSINGSGQAVGRLDGSGGIVWENASTYTVLSGVPNYINAAGTIIVGFIPGVAAAYWSRDPSTGAWRGPVQLPSLGGGSTCNGSARAINSAGIVVGESCNGSGNSQATFWQLDLSGPTPVLVGGPHALPGLGAKVPASSAAYVSDAPPYLATGGAVQVSTRLAVRWQLNLIP